MQVVSTVKEVRDIVAEWRKEGKTVGFVPTMGYLHEGHGSLISKAVEQNDKAVVSIFVNPMQFGPTEDLESYPRDLEKDSKFCESLGADLIFHPDTESTKTYACAQNVYRLFQLYPNTAQLVFCDLGTPKKGFNIYDELKRLLVEMGIPKSEIIRWDMHS